MLSFHKEFQPNSFGEMCYSLKGESKKKKKKKTLKFYYLQPFGLEPRLTSRPDSQLAGSSTWYIYEWWYIYELHIKICEHMWCGQAKWVGTHKCWF